MLGPRFDVQGQAAIWAFEELKGIVSNFKLKVDDKFLKEENLTLDGILAQIKSTLNTSERSLDFAKLDSSQPIIQKRFEQAKFYFLFRAAIFKRLEKEAIEYFQKIQHNKELRAAYHEYIVRISDANYQKMIAESEAQLLAEQEREYNQMIQAEIDRINKEAQMEWDHHHKNIVELENKIADLRQERQRIWDHYAPQLSQALADVEVDGKKIFSSLSSEKVEKIAVDYSKEVQIRDQKVLQGERKIFLVENDISELVKKEQQLVSDVRAKEGPKIVSKQEQNKDAGLLVHNKNLQSTLSSKIDNDPEVRDIRKQIIEKRQELDTLKKQAETNKKSSNDEIWTKCVEKNVSKQEFDELRPHLSEARKKFESTDVFKNAQKDHHENNLKVVETKEEKAKEQNMSKNVEVNTEKLNAKCEQGLGVTPPTPPTGSFLARRKAMQNSL